MFDLSGKNADTSGKGQRILISCVSGNPDDCSVYGARPSCVVIQWSKYHCYKQVPTGLLPQMFCLFLFVLGLFWI